MLSIICGFTVSDTVTGSLLEGSPCVLVENAFSNYSGRMYFQVGYDRNSQKLLELVSSQ
ncbi:hypothetical protein B598_0627 [Chlamydia psittaci GR9]|nr:hypothetical protein B598_0627 [Chlamydia psittaci GR9]AFS24154.1 hypothetical protein B601_0629 [Chlamydia psittaci WS/RT/E30]